MSDDPRPYQIRHLLYQNSRPALRAMDDEKIATLAREILKIADGSSSPWTKWGNERNEIARRAADLWVCQLASNIDPRSASKTDPSGIGLCR
jgi:hypothetical protein